MKGKTGRYLRGSVRIRVKGLYLSRFLNLIIQKGIEYWDVCQTGGYLEVSFAAKAFKDVAYCAKKSGNRIKVLDKRGVPFLMFRYRKRKLFCIGVLAALAIIMVLSNFLWTITIDGNTTLTKLEVLERLESFGVREGMWKWSLNCYQVKEKMLTKYSDLGWLSLTIRGSTLEVRLSESVETPDMVQKGEPKDLVSDRTCIIYSIVTRSGVPKVKKGDVVQEGDLLIAGTQEILGDDGSVTAYDYVEADGDVLGKCQYELESSVARDYIQRQYYDKEKTGLYIASNSKRTMIFKPIKNYTYYDTVEEELFAGASDFLSKLPFVPDFSIWKRTYLGYEPSRAQYSDEEMQSILEEDLARQEAALLNNKDSVILDRQVEMAPTQEGMRGVLHLTVMERIGKEQPIEKLPDPVPPQDESSQP